MSNPSNKKNRKAPAMAPSNTGLKSLPHFEDVYVATTSSLAARSGDAYVYCHKVGVDKLMDVYSCASTVADAVAETGDSMRTSEPPEGAYFA